MDATVMSEEDQLLPHSSTFCHGHQPRSCQARDLRQGFGYPGLYRHSRSRRYYGCKKLGGIRREKSLETCDRKIAERRLKEWIGNLDKVDAEVEKTTIGQFIERFCVVTGSMAPNTHVTNKAIINCFLDWWPHGKVILPRF